MYSVSPARLAFSVDLGFSGVDTEKSMMEELMSGSWFFCTMSLLMQCLRTGDHSLARFSLASRIVVGEVVNWVS